MKTHIISKFAVRDAGGGKAQVLEIRPDRPPRLPRDQGWDWQYLQCRRCEDRRSDWESVVAACVLGSGDGRVGRFDPPMLQPDGLVRISGLPYRELKLWVLSTIYLMHRATGEYWQKIVLTPDEGTRVRERVLSGKPGPDFQFQTYGQILARSSDTLNVSGGALVVDGIRELESGHQATRTIQWMALDIVWSTVLGRWPLGRWPGYSLSPGRLKEDGTWLVKKREDFSMLAELVHDFDFII